MNRSEVAKKVGPPQKNSLDPLLIKGRVKQKVLTFSHPFQPRFLSKIENRYFWPKAFENGWKTSIEPMKVWNFCRLTNHRPRTSLMFDVFWSRLFKWIQFKIYINELKLSRRILIWDVRNTNFLKNNQKWIFYWLKNEESNHFCSWWDILTPVIPHYMHCKHLSHGYSIIHKYLRLGIRGTPLLRMCF